jgi:branched-chain amino acid transport system ATP-binding protein
MPILEIQGVYKSFGGVDALKNVNIAVEEGRITALIGPNGAGKSTLFNVITGIEPANRGKIFFAGRDVSGRKPYEFAQLGVLRTFQRSMPFADLTLSENVLSGGVGISAAGRWGGLFKTKKVKEIMVRDREKAEELLRLVVLWEKREMSARNIAYGDQRRLEIARALAYDPKILLLDEPVAGMSPEETVEMAILVRRISQKGMTIFVIEHNLDMVMNLSEKIYVINYGEIIAEGKPQEIQRNEKVIEAYLGRKGIWHAAN